MARTPPPCPGNWEYTSVRGFKAKIEIRSLQLLLNIRELNATDLVSLAKGTQPSHEFLFKGLTPKYFPYFAGYYRGAAKRCLVNYEVRVPGDKKVGHTAATVQMEMDSFALRMDNSISLVDLAMGAPNAIYSEPQKLLSYVDVAAALFVYFLEIHPYANGNGHMGRMLLLAIMARHRFYPQKEWNIDPRPSDPPYTNLIGEYRNGNKGPLIQFIVDSL